MQLKRDQIYIIMKNFIKEQSRLKQNDGATSSRLIPRDKNLLMKTQKVPIENSSINEDKENIDMNVKLQCDQKENIRQIRVIKRNISRNDIK